MQRHEVQAPTLFAAASANPTPAPASGRRAMWAAAPSCGCSAPTRGATDSSNMRTSRTFTEGEGLLAKPYNARETTSSSGSTVRTLQRGHQVGQTSEASAWCWCCPQWMPCLPACSKRSLYHVREPETQRLEMGLPDFVQCSRQWRARRLYLRVSLPPPLASHYCGYSE